MDFEDDAKKRIRKLITYCFLVTVLCILLSIGAVLLFGNKAYSFKDVAKTAFQSVTNEISNVLGGNVESMKAAGSALHDMQSGNFNNLELTEEEKAELKEAMRED